MRIERENGTAIQPVWAIATRQEAWDLLGALVFYFCEDGREILDVVAEATPEVPDPEWHCHLGASEELTFAIEVDPTT